MDEYAKKMNIQVSIAHDSLIKESVHFQYFPFDNIYIYIKTDITE